MRWGLCSYDNKRGSDVVEAVGYTREVGLLEVGMEGDVGMD